MIERYTLPEMAAIWSVDNRFQTWLQVELTVMAVQESMGQVPAGTHATVKAKAQFDPARIDAIEAEVKHDVIAFLTNVSESVGEAGRWLHLGMTSSDLIDTAFALQIQSAGQLIQQSLSTYIQTIRQQAATHKHTVMVGRSHGIHAEPLTFGLKLLVWVDELERHQQRLAVALEENRVGKLSGENRHAGDSA
jgi:adenylosuccinate lyase